MSAGTHSPVILNRPRVSLVSTGRSIRAPSNWCGLYGFKPSSDRIPMYGTLSSLEGQNAIPTSLGPMSSSLSGITLFMRAILDQQPWRHDPSAIYKPWNDDDHALKHNDGGRKLCFGIMWDEGSVKPHPPVIRALEQTKKALEKAGHTGRFHESLLLTIT